MRWRIRLSVLKSGENIQKSPAMLLGAVNLTPLQVSQLFQTIGSGGNCATPSALRFRWIAEDGHGDLSELPAGNKGAVAPEAGI